MTALLWETARRALGRLFSSVEVRQRSPEASGLAVTFRRSDEIGGAEALPGTLDHPWQPTVGVRSMVPVQAETGNCESRLLPRVVVAEGWSGWGTQGCAVWDHPLQTESAAIHVPYGEWRLEKTLPRQTASLLLTPGVGTQEGRLLAKPTIAALRQEAWTFAALRSRTGLAVLSRVPLTRVRLAAPPDVLLATAFAAERQRLSAASGVPLADLILLGVYREVPVAAIRRLVVEEGGHALRLWLKRDSLSALASIRRVTLAIGRQHSTGRIVQTVI